MDERAGTLTVGSRGPAGREGFRGQGTEPEAEPWEDRRVDRRGIGTETGGDGRRMMIRFRVKIAGPVPAR